VSSRADAAVQRSIDESDLCDPINRHAFDGRCFG